MAWAVKVTSPAAVEQMNRLTILFPDSMREQVEHFLYDIDCEFAGQPISVTMDPPNTVSGESYKVPEE